MIDESDLLDASEITPNEGRPTFLTVLCILTFIGSGFGVLFGLIGFLGTSTMSAAQQSLEVPKIYTLFGLISTGLSLTGAILMWNLKLKGFWTYLTGAILNVLISLISIFTLDDAIFKATGGNARDMETLNTLLWTTFTLGLIINVTFVWMYAVNKKHLK